MIRQVGPAREEALIAPQRSTPLRALVFARAVNRLGAFSVPFLTLLLTRSLHTSLRESGLVLAAFGVASMVSRVLGGRLADTWGRRTTIVCGLLGCAAAQLAIAASTTFPEVVAAVVLLGLAFEIYESPSQALLAESVEPGNRPAAFGLLGAALSMAAIAAGLLAAVLAPVSLRLLFVVDSASCVGASLVILRLLPADKPTARKADVGAPQGRPWRDPLLRLLFGANIVFAVCYLQVSIILPLTLARRGVAASGYGVLLTVSALVVVAAQPLLRLARVKQRDGALPHRLPTHGLPIMGGYLLVAAGFAGYAVAHSLMAFVAATVVGGVGDVLLMGHVMACVSDLAPAAWRGRYLAAYGLSWGVAGTLGPLGGTILLATTGDQGLWLTAALCCGTVALAQPPILRRVNARQALANSHSSTRVGPV